MQCQKRKWMKMCVVLAGMLIPLSGIIASEENYNKNSMLALSSGSSSPTIDQDISKRSRNNTEVVQLLTQAHKAVQEENYELAKQSFYYILQIDKDNKEAQEGLKDIEKSRKLKEDANWKNEEIKKLLFYARKSFREDNMALSREFYDQVLTLDRGSAVAQAGLEAIERRQKELQEIQARQKELDHLFATAGTAFQQRDFKIAKETYSKILKLEPKNEIAHKGLVESEYLILEQGREKENEQVIQHLLQDVQSLKQKGAYGEALAKIQHACLKDPGRSDLMTLRSQLEKLVQEQKEQALIKNLQIAEAQEAQKLEQAIYRLEQVSLQKADEVYLDLKQNIKKPLVPGQYTLLVDFQNDMKSHLEQKNMSMPDCSLKKGSKQVFHFEPDHVIKETKGWLTSRQWKGFVTISEEDIHQKAGFYELVINTGYQLEALPFLKFIKLGEQFNWQGTIKIHTIHLPYGSNTTGSMEETKIMVQMKLENMRGRVRHAEFKESKAELDSQLEYEDRFHNNMADLNNTDYRDLWIQHELLLMPMSYHLDCQRDMVYQWGENTVSDNQQAKMDWSNGLKWKGNEYVHIQQEQNQTPLDIVVYLSSITPEQMIQVNALDQKVASQFIDSNNKINVLLPNYNQEKPWRYFIQINQDFVMKQIAVEGLPWDKDETSYDQIYVTGYASQHGTRIKGSKKYSFYNGHDSIEIEFNLKLH